MRANDSKQGQQATPGPWTIKIMDTMTENLAIRGATGLRIADMLDRRSIDLASDSVRERKERTAEMEANAAFIVRAVNNHDALVEALEACREQLRKAGFMSNENKAMKKADAALKAARGDA